MEARGGLTQAYAYGLDDVLQRMHVAISYIKNLAQRTGLFRGKNGGLAHVLGMNQGAAVAALAIMKNRLFRKAFTRLT